MYRTTRNTLASYSMFVYGCVLMLVLIISLDSDPQGYSFAASIFFGVLLSFGAALLASADNIGIHFWWRNILLLLLLTLSEIAIWYLLCDGVFKLKSESFL